MQWNCVTENLHRSLEILQHITEAQHKLKPNGLNAAPDNGKVQFANKSSQHYTCSEPTTYIHMGTLLDHTG